MSEPRPASGDAVADALLAARARELARPLPRPGAEEPLDLIRFTLDGDAYGIDGRYVFETLHLRHHAALASPGEPLVGIFSWRGELLPLLDLAAMDAAAARAPRAREYAVVVGEAEASFAIGADSVDGMTSLAPSAIRAADADRRAYVSGMSADGLVVLNGRDMIRSYVQEGFE